MRVRITRDEFLQTLVGLMVVISVALSFIAVNSNLKINKSHLKEEVVKAESVIRHSTNELISQNKSTTERLREITRDYERLIERYKKINDDLDVAIKEVREYNSK